MSPEAVRLDLEVCVEQAGRLKVCHSKSAAMHLISLKERHINKLTYALP